MATTLLRALVMMRAGRDGLLKDTMATTLLRALVMMRAGRDGLTPLALRCGAPRQRDARSGSRTRSVQNYNICDVLVTLPR